MAEPVRFALAQCAAAIGDEHTDPRAANLRTALRAIDAAAARGAHVVVFGEMFLSGLRTDDWLAKWAVSPHDPGEPVLAELARACARQGVTVITGTATVDEHGVCRNSVVLIDPSGNRRIYHKRHLASIRLPGGQEADEAAFYRPGDLPDVVEFDWGRLGVQICYEVTFPEPARCAMLAGADVILNCTASLSGTEDLWAAMARARAFENGVFFLVCSVVGRQGPDVYFGGSAAYGPDGVLLAQGALHEADLVIVDLPMAASRRTRREMNILPARRPELYRSLTAPVTQQLTMEG